MFDFNKVPIPDYTRAEDTVNAVTHAVGVPMIAVFVALLLANPGFETTWLNILSLVVYTLSMTALFFGSAFYHGLKPSRLKKIARVTDHSNIFAAIAGTLTPYYLYVVIRFNRPLAIVLFVLSWLVALLGIFLTYADLHRYRKVQMAMYLALGWSSLIGAWPLVRSGDADVRRLFFFILAGGLTLSVGAILYGVGKKVRYIHAVFHVFILAGVAVLFVGLYKYI